MVEWLSRPAGWELERGMRAGIAHILVWESSHRLAGAPECPLELDQNDSIPLTCTLSFTYSPTECRAGAADCVLMGTVMRDDTSQRSQRLPLPPG